MVRDLGSALGKLDDPRVLGGKAETLLQHVDIAGHLLPVDVDAGIYILATLTFPESRTSRALPTTL